LANAIRRTVEEIPTLAIEEVEILKNDSALYDEFLAQRIGLVPLKTEKKMGSKTSVGLKLEKTGPCTVFSGDFEGSAKVVYDKIPLTILEKGQKIELVGTAKLGTGIEHAKHIPGLVYYRNVLEISAGNSKIDEIVENGTGVFKAEKNGKSWICDLDENGVDKILKIDKDSVKESDEIILFVESFGMLDAKDIIIEAIGTLGNNLDEFEKQVK
jgi:DNA-directed RNA polymerase subunit D